MSVLDYLLPKSFMSDVQTTFRPKKFETLSDQEFTPGRSDQDVYNQYVNMMEQGYFIDPKVYDVLTSSSNERAAFFESLGISDDVGSWYEGITDPESEYYAFTAPEDVKQIQNIFGGQSLAEGFQQAGVSGFDPSMASPMKLSSLRNIDPGSYAKETSMKRGTLADKLASRRATASQVGGGFAGYGRRNLAEDLAEQQFIEGSRSVMEDVNKQRADALSELYAGLEDYQGLISSMEG